MSWQSPMLLLAGDSIAYSKVSATLSATACKHFTTVGGRHAFTESMLIYSFSVRGLKRSFHRCIMFCLLSRRIKRVQNYIKHLINATSPQLFAHFFIKGFILAKGGWTKMTFDPPSRISEVFPSIRIAYRTITRVTVPSVAVTT